MDKCLFAVPDTGKNKKDDQFDRLCQFILMGREITEISSLL